ncbi:30S ribosomal protein S2 [Acaryochloris sp. IP29b_bin.137]|uniref:30S ribosomal protein S2 n=1 Tax=Acaryochloris sp. IP29b_bin.137 TaxID=2969217 RepID=UPI00261597B7|nr:30S ribosomal protein S2 [Acaryochloris sp. IP29b_bin.137]
MPVISLAQMLESGVHFGHQARRWNPKMDPYIFTERNGVHIIDLVQTAQLMDEAFHYVRSASESGKKFLFVGTKRQAAGIIAQEAARCGGYYVNQRWLGGMLTNWATIKTRIERLKDLERRYESGIFDLLPKQEASMLRRELDKLQKYLGGLKQMHKIPDVVVIIDIRREYNAVQECQKLGLPIVSLLDTNCDPDWVDIPIPANDDAIRSIKLIIGKLADAIYEGRHGQVSADTFAEDIPSAVDFDDDEITAEPIAEAATDSEVAVEEPTAEVVAEEPAAEATAEEAPTAEAEAPPVE